MAQNSNQQVSGRVAVQAAEWRSSLRFLHAFCGVFARAYHRVEVVQPVRLPASGAGILVCNHISALDPLLLQAVIKRPIVWMMAREYYDLPLLGRLFKHIEAIPVDRTGRDSAAMRSALRALHRGRLLGLFPEGKIETSRQLLAFQSGAALLAIRSACPVYPFYLEGTQRGHGMATAVVFPQEAVLRCGPALNFASGFSARSDLDAANAQIEAAVRALIPAGAGA